MGNLAIRQTDLSLLLIVGVFLAGVVKSLSYRRLDAELAGKNTPVGQLPRRGDSACSCISLLWWKYPIAKMFLDLGMHHGPLLAYRIWPTLSCDPEYPGHGEDPRAQENRSVCRIGLDLQYAGRLSVWAAALGNLDPLLLNTKRRSAII